MDEIFSSDFITFCKDENYIYIKDSSQSDTAYLMKISLTNGSKEYVFNDENYDIDEVLVNVNTKEIEAVSVYSSRRVWQVINEDVKDDFQFLRNLGLGDLGICSRDNSDSLWIVSFNRDTTGIIYYLFNRRAKAVELLFYGNSQLINYDLASMEAIEFQARDGVKLSGYITMPKIIGEKIPLVVNVHGGPQSRDYFGYNKDVQWLVSKGYG